MINCLNDYEKIANYLEDDISNRDIALIKKSLDNKNFILTFVGQFSSGKSKLINNIIGKDLLPVKIKESTQVPTLISYGKEEKAIIFYEDNTKEEITIKKVKDIWLGNESVEFNNIDYIEIYIESDLLENGLIIADTPGVNSVVEKHEKLTRKIIRSSEEIIYVLSKPMTYIDQMFLNEIEQIGLNIICVRTFMDTIKSNEENIEDVISYDKKSIENIADSSIIKIYHVSNEENSPWFEKIGLLKKYIELEISHNVEDKLKNSCNLKLLTIKENLKRQLENKKETLELLLENNKNELDRGIEETDAIINNIEKMLITEKNDYLKNCRQVRKEAKKELSNTKEYILDNTKKSIDNIGLNDNIESELQNTMYTKISSASKKMQEAYIEPFDRFIYDSSILLENKLKEVSENIDVNYEIPSSFNELALTVDLENDEIEQLKSEIFDIAEYIENRENEIMSLDSDREQYENEKKEIENLVEEVKKEIENQGPYQEKFIKVESEGLQPSEVLKMIGSGLDLATFFIPGKAYTKIAGKLGKGIAVSNKVKSQIKKADTIKDSLYALKNIDQTIKSTRQTVKRTEEVINAVETINKKCKTKGILDILTFEYWFEKVGSNFDKLDVYEVDKEYEKEYLNTQRMLNEKYSNLVKKELSKLEELGIIKDEKAKLKKEKEIAERRNKELQNELVKKQKEIKLNAQKNYFISIKNTYYNLFKTSIDELESKIILEYDKYLEGPLENYYEKSVAEFKFELNKNKKIKEDILNKFESNTIKQNQDDLQICNKYIQLLEG